MMDKNEYSSLSVSDKWRLFRDTQDRLENAKIENKTLRAKLVKADLVAKYAEYLMRVDLSASLDTFSEDYVDWLKKALSEYRVETK